MASDPPDQRRSRPPVWAADEDDGATRIEAFDPEKLAALAAAAAESAPSSPADASVESYASSIDTAGVEASSNAEDAGPGSLRADTILPVEVEDPSLGSEMAEHAGYVPPVAGLPSSHSLSSPAPARAPVFPLEELDESELTVASSSPPLPQARAAPPRVVSIPSRTPSAPAIIPPVAVQVPVVEPPPEPAPQPQPHVTEPSTPSTVQEMIARIDMDLEPLESLPQVPAQDSYRPPAVAARPFVPRMAPQARAVPAEPMAPAAVVPVAPAVVAPMAPTAPTPLPPQVGPAFGQGAPIFDPGPEPTQIGAKPLISFGETSPLSALVGEAPLRTPARGPAEVQATFLPEPKQPLYRERRVQIAAAIAIVLLIVTIIVLAS